MTRTLMTSTLRRWIAVVLGAVLAAAALSAPPSPAQAIGGGQPVAGDPGFTVRMQIGAQRACSGTLVRPNWVLTAASCFPAAQANEAAAAVPAGTTATIGRADLSTGTTGRKVAVLTLVPHTDRDIALVEVDGWFGKPIAIATTPPAPGEKLTGSGYGRTADTWVPDTAHSATFTAQTVTGTAITLTGDDPGAAICEGDAGGPTYRVRAGQPELVAVHTSSGLRGCHGAPEDATAEATGTRVDDLATWMQAATTRTQVPAGDNRAWDSLSYPCYSPNGGTRLKWGEYDDGLLQVYDTQRRRYILGGADTDGGAILRFRNDGNLVIYDRNNQPIWQSNTWGHPDARLECRDDGDVRIYDGTALLWRSGTGTTLEASAGYSRTYTDRFEPVCISRAITGQLWWFEGGLAARDGWRIQGHGRWPKDRTLRFGTDGALVVAKGDGKPLWTSPTRGHPNAQLNCHDDGSFTIDDQGTTLWNSAGQPSGLLMSAVGDGDLCARDYDGLGTLTDHCEGEAGFRLTRPQGTVQSMGRDDQAICLQVKPSSPPKNGDKISGGGCATTPETTWTHRADGSLYNPKTNRCLDVPGGRPTPGAQLQVWTCNGTNAQKWNLWNSWWEDQPGAEFTNRRATTRGFLPPPAKRRRTAHAQSAAQGVSAEPEGCSHSSALFGGWGRFDGFLSYTDLAAGSWVDCDSGWIDQIKVRAQLWVREWWDQKEAECNRRWCTTLEVEQTQPCSGAPAHCAGRYYMYGETTMRIAQDNDYIWGQTDCVKLQDKLLQCSDNSTAILPPITS